MNAKIKKAQLPRLLYLSDVPVESSYHGSALIYRLLKNYPSEKLRIIEGNQHRSLPERRLSAVNYHTMYLGNNRLLYTRFHAWYLFWLYLIVGAKHKKVNKILGNFTPEAVLTVTNHHLWLAAAEYAKHSNIPLHVIVHDDLPQTICVPNFYRKFLEQRFSNIYRYASSRLCISPFMAEEYFKRYGVKATVIYPSRGSDTPLFSRPNNSLIKSKGKLVFAFAGSLYEPYAIAIQKLAECLFPINGQVFIYGNLSIAQAKAANLNLPNVHLKGLLSSNDLIKELHSEVDVLFVPMSFELKDRSNAEISFPSKLVDYTSVGLPLLIYGPPYCSAVRWARDNPGVAEVVDTDENDDLASAVRRLFINGKYRLKLARSAIEAGNRYFSYKAAWKTFTNSLARTKL